MARPRSLRHPLPTPPRPAKEGAAAVAPRRTRRLRDLRPVYTHPAVAARARKTEVQSVDRTWIAGACGGRGFHDHPQLCRGTP